MEQLDELRADLSAKQRAYYRALDAHRDAATDGWSRASGERTKMREEMLRAHREYSEARERLLAELARRRSTAASGINADRPPRGT